MDEKENGEKEEEVVVLADGAVLKNGRVLTEDEEKAEAESQVLLRDAIEREANREIAAIEDGAIRYHDGPSLEPQEAEAETLLLGDALKREATQIAAPAMAIHSPKIAPILNAPDTPAHHEKRKARLEKINKLMAENSNPAPQQDERVPNSEQASEEEEKE